MKSPAHVIPVPPQKSPKLRRMLIEADRALHEPFTLDPAIQVARPIGARLAGCFVEDQALIDLAGLPFASEVSFSGTVRPLERERLMKQWRGQAVQAERAFADMANAAGLDWSFEVRRGRPIFSLLEGAVREDIVVLRTNSRLSAPGEVARAVRAATSDIHADVLLTGGEKSKVIDGAGDTLVVLDDMTSRGQACCLAAEGLAKKAGLVCVVLPCRNADLLDMAGRVRQMLPALTIADMHASLFVKDEDATRFSIAAGFPTLFFGSERAAGDYSGLTINETPD